MANRNGAHAKSNDSSEGAIAYEEAVRSITQDPDVLEALDASREPVPAGASGESPSSD